jgi:hypothetical protein
MKVRVAAFSISLDGFGAGPRQDINNPLGGWPILAAFFAARVGSPEMLASASFAPSELDGFFHCTHSLRCGLHSFAASRLGCVGCGWERYERSLRSRGGRMRPPLHESDHQPTRRFLSRRRNGGRG